MYRTINNIAKHLLPLWLYQRLIGNWDQSGFKKYFSFGVILLSLVFAALLVNYGVKFNNLKTQIKENKDSMYASHRLATVGKFASGYQSETGKSFVNIENSVALLKSELKGTADSNLKLADQLCSSILKSTAEVKIIASS